MRILHVINRCGIANGAAKLLLDVVSYQLDCGNEIDIVSLVDTTPSYEEQFRAIGCQYTSIMPCGYNMKDPILLIRLCIIMRNYDIVHAHLFPSFYWVALAKVIYRLKCKLIVTEHATENNRRRLWLRPLERYIYNQYNGIIAISIAVKKNLLHHLHSNYNVSVIENGINIQKYSDAEPMSRQDIGIPYDDAIILTQVAGFRSEKDQITVLKALSQLPNKYHIMFVGDGRLLQQHINVAKELNIFSRCHFLGARSDVPSLLKISDIIIQSSHFEGFGLAAVEGMASKKPVIAANVPGLSEVVMGAGLLFEQGDVRGLVQNIQSLSNNPRFYNEIADRCYNRALLYDISITAEKYNNIYNIIFD